MIEQSAIHARPGAAGSEEQSARRDPLALLMAWFIPMVIVGYPIAGASTIFLRYVEPTTVTYGYRTLVVVLAGLAIMGALLRRRAPVFPVALTLFLVAYLVRLYVDDYINGVFRADFAMLFYAGGVLPPVVAVLFAGRVVQAEQLIRTTFYAALTACALLFMIGFLGLQSELISSMEQTGGRLNLETVNSITIGHVGATLLIACVAAWYHPGRGVPRILIAIASIIAVATMFQAGSRGPFVALGFCLIVYSVVTRRWGVLFAGLVGVVVVALTSSGDQIVILDRFTTVGWDKSSAAQFITQDYAIADFLDHPLVGNAYIEPATLDYPHNLIIDTAMSLGLVGLVLLAIVLFQAGREVVSRLREREFLVALLFLEFFMAAQFSGSIWGHSNLLTATALLLVWSRTRREAAAIANPALR